MKMYLVILQKMDFQSVFILAHNFDLRKCLSLESWFIGKHSKMNRENGTSSSNLQLFVLIFIFLLCISQILFVLPTPNLTFHQLLLLATLTLSWGYALFSILLSTAYLSRNMHLPEKMKLL